MSDPEYSKQLVILTADLDAENTFHGILGRSESLHIRPLSEQDYDIVRHPQHDSGCYGQAVPFLQTYHLSHRYALVVFDRHGSGKEELDRTVIEEEVENQLENAGWKERCAAIVLDPELEIWVWSDSPHVDAELGWKGKKPSLREWLVSQEFLKCGSVKPWDPKRAMEEALRLGHKPRSARIFSCLAKKVSLDRCSDPAFIKLKQCLQKWFPIG